MSSYINAVLADTPLYYWPMDDASGVFRDASGNGRHSTTPSGTWVYREAVSGVPGSYSARSTGGGAGATIPSIGGAVPFTMEWWVRPWQNINYNNAHSLGQGWGSYHSHSGASSELWAGTETTNRFTQTDTGTDYMPVNVWSYIVFTYDGGAGRLYKNSVLTHGPRTMTNPTATTDSSIGAVDANVQHVAVYAIALSAARIAAHYRAAQHNAVVGGG